MNENKIRLYYPLFQFISILGLAILIVPLSMIAEWKVNDDEVLYSVELDFFKYGLNVTWILFAALIINVLIVIGFVIYYFTVIKKYPSINLFSAIPPEINENDEGLSFVSYQALKSVYSFVSYALPVLVGILIFIPDNWMTKPLIVGILMFIAAMMYLIYFFKTKTLLK